MASGFRDLLGTSLVKFQVGLGAAGLAFKVASGKFRARNVADSADAPIVGSIIAASGDSIQINEDAIGSGADWAYNLNRPATGMTSALTLTLPPDAGTNGFAFTTNGAGITSWQAVAGGADKPVTDTTSVVFGSTSPLANFTLPANALVTDVTVIIDTPFTGGTGATLSVGIAGTTAKYMGSGSLDLLAAAGTSFSVMPNVIPLGTSEAIITTYAAAGATAGAARVLTTYVIPS